MGTTAGPQPTSRKAIQARRTIQTNLAVFAVKRKEQF